MKAAPAKTPAVLYAADLARAVAGAKKAPFPAGVAGIGGMTCSPGTLSGTSPASRALTLTLTLPADAAARCHVLAVVTPERGLLEIFSPYDDAAAEAGDLIVPSQAISWSKARTQHRFAVGTDDLDGLRRDQTMPEVLLLEPGRYRFALVNGIDAALLKSSRTEVKVTAACSVDWAPQDGIGRSTRPSSTARPTVSAGAPSACFARTRRRPAFPTRPVCVIPAGNATSPPSASSAPDAFRVAVDPVSGGGAVPNRPVRTPSPVHSPGPHRNERPRRVVHHGASQARAVRLADECARQR